MSTPKSVIENAEKNGAEMVDLKFVYPFGTRQHFSCPSSSTTTMFEAARIGKDTDPRAHLFFASKIEKMTDFIDRSEAVNNS